MHLTPVVSATHIPVQNSGSVYVYERHTGGINNWGEAQILNPVDAAANDNFGRSVAISGSVVIAGADRNDDDGTDSGSAYVFTGRNLNWQQVSKPVAVDGTENDQFGVSVAISGDYAIVGSHGDDDAGSSSGSAYIFARDIGGANNWGQVKKLTASDAAETDSFGHSVSISGDFAVVGARLNDDSGTSSGSAYVFNRDQGGADNWGEVKKLTASDATAGHQFGISVAIAGDVVVVGAHGGPNGSAYVFERNEGGANNFGETKKLVASDGSAGDQFGNAVAISGDTAIVGAMGDDNPMGDAGSAYIFDRNQGGTNNWGEVQKLSASDADNSDQFGQSVAISGDTVIVGTMFNDDAGTSTGSAYIFRQNEGGTNNWGEVKKLTASDAVGGDQFGRSVSISGDKAIIGANGNDDVPDNSGSVYIFGQNEGGTNNWGEVEKLTATDAAANDQFGFSVAISADTAIVGAYLVDITDPASGSKNKPKLGRKSQFDKAERVSLAGSNQGAAYVFEAITAPIPGSANVTGRIVDNSGKGLFRVAVILTDGGGSARVATTNPFGYFRFVDVPAGQTYIMTAVRKEYIFPGTPQAVTVNDDIDDLEVTGILSP